MIGRPQTEIVYEDKAIIVCVKLEGVSSEDSRGSSIDMVNLLKRHVSLTARTQNPYIACVHRLDVPVAGLMVYAKTKKAAASLSAQIKDHTFEKEYVCLVSGAKGVKPAGFYTTRRDMIRFDSVRNISTVVKPGVNDPTAKEAVLSYRVLLVVKDKALVRVKLVTGRHHQIRVQMAALFHGIVGDTKYNPDYAGSGRQKLCLECCRLSFDSPVDGKRQTFSREPSFAGSLHLRGGKI